MRRAPRNVQSHLAEVTEKHRKREEALLRQLTSALREGKLAAARVDEHEREAKRSRALVQGQERELQ